MYFHLYDFNLKNFRDEIISLYKNDDPLYIYDFQTNSTYHLHLFLPSGEVISKLPFKLLSAEDKEDLLESIYLDLLPDMDVYLRGLEVLEYFEYPSYIGLYISSMPEDRIKPKDLVEHKDKYLNNNLMLYKKEYINNTRKISLALLLLKLLSNKR